MKNRKITYFVLIIVLIMIFTGCSTQTIDVEASNIDLNLSTNTIDLLKTISTVYPNRNIDSNDASEGFTSFIANTLENFGYETEQQDFIFTYTTTAGGTATADITKSSVNVIGKKQVSDAKGTILLSCYYDNSYEDKYNNDSAYENGAAIAVLLSLAEYYYSHDSNYNLIFAFFGAGQYAWKGAKHYLNSLSLDEKDAISLAINYGMLCGGDNLYMYSRDYNTSYNNYFYSISGKNEISNISKVPSNKRPIEGSFDSDVTLKYFHVGMLGNQYYYIDNEIPSVAYMSLNWKDQSQVSYVEIKGQQNVMNTENDSYENMIKRVGSESEVAMRLNDILVSTILSIDTNQTVFDEVLTKAKTENNSKIAQSTTVNYIFGVGLKILLIFMLVAVYITLKTYLKKNLDKYHLNKNTITTVQFNQKDIDDIFGDDKNNKDDSNDDIFS